MGVRGLQGFVASSCPRVCTVVNFKELAEQHQSKHPGCTPTVVVDAMCCLRYWYIPESWVCGGQWKEYFSVLRDFVRIFTDVGIKLVFFFDGMVEKEKRDVWVKRRLKNNREIARIFQYIKKHREQPSRSMFFIPSGLAIFTRFALKTLGQETLCSLQEADYEVASYGLQNNCLGILGEDTDYLIYDSCPYFSISELCLDSLNTVMFCREKLCASLGLCLADLPLLACLLGNDVVPEGMFENFRYKCLSFYTSVKENCDRRGSIILAVADHIAKVLRVYQGEKKLEEMLPLGPNKALFYKGIASYLLPGQTSPWIPPKAKAITTLHMQVVSVGSDPESKQQSPESSDPESKQESPKSTDSESKQESPVCTDPESKQESPMCTDPESKQEDPMCTDPESKQEVPMCTDSESKQEVPMCTDSEIKQEVPMCTDPEFKEEDPMNMEPESQRQVTMVTDTEILKVARAQHVQAESYLVYNIMASGEIECSNTLEDVLDQALPSQAFVYRPVRQRVYSLLLADGQDGASCPPVQEWFVYSGNPLTHPDLVRPLQISLPGGTPSLKLLWLNHEPGTQARRMEVLLACFDLSSSSEELQAVESPFQALCCLLTYLFVQVDTLSLEDLHAFIAQALCLPGKSAGQLADLQLDHVDPRAVQLGSLLVRGLTMLLLVNSACGSPWSTSDLMPWNLFDGKLFHEKYLQAQKGYSVEALVEQNRALLTHFHQLKSVVCKACQREDRRIASRQLWQPLHSAMESSCACALSDRQVEEAERPLTAPCLPVAWASCSS
ncbi:constitutive coactivator of peroxisome proliferator-activated receptor gamma isoform X2 [Pipistrellus kuhlii]|uniref:constitutive coactivator of peroxisome proliferator-activated receptor gamma isoform X2 n=1 Tax=Pipistrellus kuhlii TaxID=59472 RepID=UPI001E27157C|nr:constitutive coactivator of peroxisome proliferator-activated receptor gamma isoform X2 [Pipistrellus kuhlii]